ncbi:MAG TPA: helix-turn-helix domain-containing protein [Oligoflexia bacterium]|nr:helix-turn-helix domain-containing protein [bacterium]HMQ11350.1 helix-turn-helix domain-containing protein [Oligoflexia bacterium]HMR24084.1 helix-turn-helix domain-containing protein [Oligoflexia bacterium]
MKKNNIDQQAKALLEEIMAQCKQERKKHSQIKSKDVAKKLGMTANYVSSIESLRSTPALLTFLKYLIINDFDLLPLKNLRIRQKYGSKTQLKSETMDIMSKFDESQMAYIFEIAKALKDIG